MLILFRHIAIVQEECEQGWSGFRPSCGRELPTARQAEGILGRAGAPYRQGCQLQAQPAAFEWKRRQKVGGEEPPVSATHKVSVYEFLQAYRVAFVLSLLQQDRNPGATYSTYGKLLNDATPRYRERALCLLTPTPS